MLKTQQNEKTTYMFYSDNFHRNRFWRLLLKKKLQRERFFSDGYCDRRPADRDVASRFVCVSVCYPLWLLLENPYRPASSVRELSFVLQSCIYSENPNANMQKHRRTILSSFSLTEDAGRRGFSFRFKEGTTQKHTQSVKQHRGRPAQDRKRCFSKRLKNIGFEHLQREINIAKHLQR